MFSLNTAKRSIALTLALSMTLELAGAAPLGTAPTSNFSLALPPSLGSISEAYAPRPGATRPDMILIQNLHVNRSVQFAISGILKHLKQQNLIPKQIAVEGATGPMDIVSMQVYPDAQARKAAADYLVRQGEMPGAMHFAVTEGVDGRTDGRTALYGVETAEVYNANLEVYQRSYQQRLVLKEELDKLKRALPRLRRNSALREKVDLLDKDIQAVTRLVNTQTISNELPKTLNQVMGSIDRLKLLLPKQVGDSLLETLSAGTHFYAFAKMRDEDLFNNTLTLRQQTGQTTTILITGGFHTQGLMEQCKAKGLSYVVITPDVRKHDAVDERLYTQRLLGYHLTSEQIAQGLDWASMDQLEPVYPLARGALPIWKSALRAVTKPVGQKIITVLIAVLAPFAAMMSGQVRQPAVVAIQNQPVTPFTSEANGVQFIREQRGPDETQLPSTFRMRTDVHMPGSPEDPTGRTKEMIIRQGIGLYDTSVAIDEMINTGNFAEAKSMIKNYHRRDTASTGPRYGTDMEIAAYPRPQNTTENPRAFFPFSRNAYYLFNFTRNTGAWSNDWQFWNAITGENSHFVRTMSHYVLVTGDRDPEILGMINTIANAMLLLQDAQTQGGIRFGPVQYHDPADPDQYFRINSENQGSAFAALRYAAEATGDGRYSSAADKVWHWMSEADIYNPETRQMQKGMLNPRTNTFYVDAVWSATRNRWEILPETATDSGGTWSISSFSPKRIDDRWGKGTSYKMYLSLRSEMGRTANFRTPVGNEPIAGFDFSNKFPNQGLISPEWSVGGLKANLQLQEYYNFKEGKGVLSEAQLTVLNRDYGATYEFVHRPEVSTKYAVGPGMNAPRNGQTGWGWYSARGDAMAAIWVVYSVYYDPLDTRDLRRETLVAQVTRTPGPQATQVPAAPTDTGVLAEGPTGQPYRGTIGDFAVWATGPFNLPSGTQIRIHFPTSQAGTRFRLRLLPMDGNANQPTGSNPNPYTIPANGIVEITIRAADFGLREEQMTTIDQMSFHSGANGFGPLNQPANRQAVFERIERVNAGRAGVAPAPQVVAQATPAPQAPVPQAAPAPAPAQQLPAAANRIVIPFDLGSSSRGDDTASAWFDRYATNLAGYQVQVSLTGPRGTKVRAALVTGNGQVSYLPEDRDVALNGNPQTFTFNLNDFGTDLQYGARFVINYGQNSEDGRSLNPSNPQPGQIRITQFVLLSAVPVAQQNAPGRAVAPPVTSPTPRPQAVAPVPQTAGEVLANGPSAAPYQGTIGDFAVWVLGQFNLPSGTRLRLTFPASQAGTKFRLRLLPANGNANQPDGANDRAFTIPANGIVELTIRAADFGLTEAQLRTITQISVHSGANGFGELGQAANKHAIFQKIEKLKSGRASLGEPIDAVLARDYPTTPLVEQVGAWFNSISIPAIPRSLKLFGALAGFSSLAGAAPLVAVHPILNFIPAQVAMGSLWTVSIPVYTIVFVFGMAALITFAVKLIKSNNKFSNGLGLAGIVAAVSLTAVFFSKAPINSISTPKITAAPTPQNPPANQQDRGFAMEFNGPANSKPDPMQWTYDLGASGWGNNELENYTDSAENAHLDGKGHLVIHVENKNGRYTSARLKTQGRISAQYGHLEARLKLPTGQGIWPAWWMLGSTFNGNNWPGAGEIDIMENRGRQPSDNFGTIHGPGYSGGNGISNTYRLPNGQKFSDDFHTFAIDWTPQGMKWSVDGNVYHSATRDSLPAGVPWVFDQPFFMILNVAVGGNFGGNPDSTTKFPQELVVDYIRYVPLAGGVAAAIPVPQTVPAPMPQAPAAVPPATTRSMQTELIASRAQGPFIGTIGDYAVWAVGQFDLPSGTVLHITFPAEQAGTKFRLRLLPEGGPADQPVGLNRTIQTVPANGVFEITVNAGDFGLSEAELHRLGQISLHSGKDGFGPLPQDSDKHATFEKIEKLTRRAGILYLSHPSQSEVLDAYNNMPATQVFEETAAAVMETLAGNKPESIPTYGHPGPGFQVAGYSGEALDAVLQREYPNTPLIERTLAFLKPAMKTAAGLFAAFIGFNGGIELFSQASATPLPMQAVVAAHTAVLFGGFGIAMVIFGALSAFVGFMVVRQEWSKDVSSRSPKASLFGYIVAFFGILLGLGGVFAFDVVKMMSTPNVTQKSFTSTGSPKVLRTGTDADGLPFVEDLVGQLVSSDSAVRLNAGKRLGDVVDYLEARNRVPDLSALVANPDALANLIQATLNVMEDDYRDKALQTARTLHLLPAKELAQALQTILERLNDVETRAIAIEHSDPTAYQILLEEDRRLAGIFAFANLGYGTNGRDALLLVLDREGQRQGPERTVFMRELLNEIALRMIQQPASLSGPAAQATANFVVAHATDPRDETNSAANILKHAPPAKERAALQRALSLMQSYQAPVDDPLAGEEIRARAAKFTARLRELDSRAEKFSPRALWNTMAAIVMAVVLFFGHQEVIQAQTAPQASSAKQGEVLQVMESISMGADQIRHYDEGSNHAIFWDFDSAVRVDANSYVDVTVSGDKGTKILIRMLDSRASVNSPNAGYFVSATLNETGEHTFRVPVKKFTKSTRIERISVDSGEIPFNVKLNKEAKIVEGKGVKVVNLSPAEGKKLGTSVTEVASTPDMQAPAAETTQPKTRLVAELANVYGQDKVQVYDQGTNHAVFWDVDMQKKNYAYADITVTGQKGTKILIQFVQNRLRAGDEDGTIRAQPQTLYQDGRNTFRVPLNNLAPGRIQRVAVHSGKEPYFENLNAEKEIINGVEVRFVESSPENKDYQKKKVIETLPTEPTASLPLAPVQAAREGESIDNVIAREYPTRFAERAWASMKPLFAGVSALLAGVLGLSYLNHLQTLAQGGTQAGSSLHTMTAGLNVSSPSQIAWTVAFMIFVLAFERTIRSRQTQATVNALEEVLPRMPVTDTVTKYVRSVLDNVPDWMRKQFMKNPAFAARYGDQIHKMGFWAIMGAA